MEAAKSAIKRIKWKPVISLVIVVVLFILLATNMPNSGTTSGSIKLSIDPEEKKISPGEEVIIKVEVENRDSEKTKQVIVELTTFDLNLKFTDTMEKTRIIPQFNIGPKETRKFNVILKSTPNAVNGKYTIQAKAISDSVKPAQDRAQIELDSTQRN